MIGGPKNFALRLLLIAVFLGAWEAAVRGLDIPAFILPTPSSVFVALYRGFASSLYIDHIGVTVAETLIGFVLGTALAFVLGTVIALSRPVEYFLYPFVVMFQAMPKVALAPLIIVWFGLGLTSKVVNAALVAFFPLMVNTIVGLRSAEEDKVNLMKSLAATRGQIFWMLQLPNAMPYIFAGLEIAMIFALIGAIVAEFVGATAGLGMLIQSMNFTMDVAGQFSVLLLLSMIGLLLNWIVISVRKRVLFWDPSQKFSEAAKKDMSWNVQRSLRCRESYWRALSVRPMRKPPSESHGARRLCRRPRRRLRSPPRWAGSPKTASRSSWCRCRARPIASKPSPPRTFNTACLRSSRSRSSGRRA